MKIFMGIFKVSLLIYRIGSIQLGIQAVYFLNKSLIFIRRHIVLFRFRHLTQNNHL